MHDALHPGAIICSTGDKMEILIEIVVLWEEQKTGSHPYGSIAKAS